jgi:hypothetical protein
MAGRVEIKPWLCANGTSNWAPIVVFFHVLAVKGCLFDG